MDELLYEGKAYRDTWLKVILMGIILSIALPASYSYLLGNTLDAALMMATAAFIAIVFAYIIPTKYYIFSSKMQIVFRRPFVFTIPFSFIERARVPRVFSLTVNFPSSLSGRQAVEIVRRKRMNVLITPDNPAEFMEKLNSELKRYTQQVKGQ